jgi:hypothetical protein
MGKITADPQSERTPNEVLRPGAREVDICRLDTLFGFHVSGNGPRKFEFRRRLRLMAYLEGIVSKRKDSPYR